MAIRQYIGARYVLKIYENSLDPQSADWEANTAYEPLVMVNYNNSSYISRKDVPANIGNPVDNPTYWALSGLYNGQIAALQSQLNDLGNDVQTLDANKVLELRERHFIFVGDSYNIINAPTRWITECCNALGLTHHQDVASGGYGFNPVSGNKWLTLLQNTVITDPDEVTDIVIGGGANDTGVSETDLRSAMSAFDTYVKTTFPKLKRIYLAYMAWNFGTASARQDMKNCYLRYMKIARELGWAFMNGPQYVLHNPDNILTGISDTMHPNPNGTINLGLMVAQCLVNGSGQYHFAMASNFTPDTTNVTGSDTTLRTELHNDRIDFRMPDITLTAAQNLSGTFTAFECTDAIGSEFPCNQYKNVPAWINNTMLTNILMYQTDPKHIQIWLRGGATLSAGDTLVIPWHTFSYPAL